MVRAPGFEQSGKIDWYYLSGLSADAVPALADLPEEYHGCVLQDMPPAYEDDWLEWNLGRARAGDARLDASAGCTATIG